MRRPLALLPLLSVPALFGALPPAQRPAPPASAPSSSPESLDALLEPIRAKHGLPALAGAIVRGDRVVAIGAVGVRRHGSPTPVTTQDLWHLGSCTKSMTATLIARLVDRGVLSWDATIAGVFPDRRPGMAEGWERASLPHLLTHRSGAPADLSGDGLWGRLWRREGSPTDQRLRLLDGVIVRPPLSQPGTKHLYANAGFAIAGAMAEKATGKAWEDLMRQELFGPLGMSRAGFGAPGSADRLDQPRGHGPGPVEPGPFADNPPAIGPAGTVHAPLEDWAKYAALHLSGARGTSHFVQPETWKRLHTPPEGETYACGWVVREQGWAGGRTLWHNGSNTMWYAEVWIAPEKDVAFLTATNLGGDAARKGSAEAATALRGHALGGG
ncbi:MAG: beta-lactamase family protein [Planctomycetes bacterium]|nr:beta-lactamase family protein [Planctomycetota bacterium]